VNTEDHQKDILLDEAAGWVARLCSDRVSSYDKQRFSLWLNQSNAHQQAFDDTASTWETLGAAAYVPSAQTVLNPRPQMNSSQPNRLSRWFDSVTSLPGGLVTASVAIAVALFAALAPSPQTGTNVDFYSTSVGEQRSVTLSDGSIVDLNTHTRVEVSYRERQRNINLVQGEAYFSVSSDKSRPFVVSIDGAKVTAVGTEFNIYRKEPMDIAVTVTEGIVEVTERPDVAIPNPNPILVKRDGHVTIGPRGLSRVSKVVGTKNTAWRSKTLVFNNTSLVSAIAELNRYLPYVVDASNPALHKLFVSGTFSTDAPDETLLAIASSFKLSILESDNNKRTLSP